MEKLIAAQNEFYPGSTFYSLKEMRDWCESGYSDENKLNRYRLLALAMNYDEVLFYRTQPLAEDSKGCLGFRFGINGYEYISGFSVFE